jgi:uncharacterized membrane protein
MRIGFLIAGMVLIVLTYVIVSSPALQVQIVFPVIDTMCTSFFGTAGLVSSPKMLAQCQTYLSLKSVYYFIGVLLLLLGILLKGRPKSSAKESRAGGNVWNEPTSAEKAIDKDALKALKVRYAKGEITKEQYGQMLEDLREDSPHHSPDNMQY